MAETVTPTVRVRERTNRNARVTLPDRLAALSERLRANYDARPVSRAEWDCALGDVSGTADVQAADPR